MSNIVLNTHLSCDTLALYMKENNISEEITDNMIIFNKLSNRRYVQPTDHSLNVENNIGIDEIKIGDIIKVSYCTDSQRYMFDEEYQTFTGRVFFIDIKNKNILFYYDKFDEKSGKFIKTITSLLRPYCSYYGDHPGYSTQTNLVSSC